MRPALDPAGHRVPRTKPTCLLHTWRPHRRRPLALVLHLHQHQSCRNLLLQYLAKNQSTQCCQSLITQGSDHPPILEPHMVLNSPLLRPSPCYADQFVMNVFTKTHLLRVLMGLHSLLFILAKPLFFISSSSGSSSSSLYNVSSLFPTTCIGF
jgi:hypothetical protein